MGDKEWKQGVARLISTLYRWAIHADVLAKHDKRLTRLESKRA